MLGAVVVTCPAAAQERAAETELKSRDAKTTEAKPPPVDGTILGLPERLQIGIPPKEDGQVREVPSAGQAPLAPIADPGEPIDHEEIEADASRRRMGQALGAAGALAAAVGTYLVGATLIARPNMFREFATGRAEFWVAGFAGIGVGAGLMLGGFSLATANRPAPVGMDRTPVIVDRQGFSESGVTLSGKF